ncbi:MAG: helix-turn-helix transcriptional regulator [Provencibacterium sp.]|nr:helix-turn-helix transcriptional regulator [Provencibacterium sp.]
MSNLLYRDLCIHSCGITACQPDWKWDTAGSPMGDYDLWTVLKGSGFLTADGLPFPVSAGSCFLLRPHGCYAGRQELSDRLTVLHIHFDFLWDGLPLHLPEGEVPALHRQLFDFPFVQKLLYKVLNASSAGEKEMARHWLQVALDEITLQDRQGLQPDPLRRKLSALCDEIQENPGADWRLSPLAARFGYAADYFGRLFSQMTGSPLSLYVIGARMNQAKVLLRSSSSRIGEIALQLGYRDTCFFSRQFRQHTGVTPSAYRQAVRPEERSALPEQRKQGEG